MKRLSIGFLILSAALIMVLGGCGGKASDDETLSVNQLLGNPVKYLGREVTFQARVVMGEAIMGSFIVEDMHSDTSATIMRLVVFFMGNHPHQGAVVEITGKMTIIGLEYIFSAEEIEYIENKME
ncbi:MAG: hypothetical protein HQ591_04745 [candidate division Zixibacteria bacterium]|nr:hypothetical protein [Candidatus Tariuqbacter arcticus]